MFCNPGTFPQHGSFRARRICIGLLGTVAAQLFGGGPLRDFEAKAVALYNVARFVEWPSQAFASDESPLTIGILGADPLGSLLASTVDGERVHGRPISVVHYRTVADITTCHLLFISGTESPRIDEIMSALGGRPILTVCDWERPGANTARFRFAFDGGGVRLQVNLEATQAAGLAVSSKLLRSAELVRGAATQP